MVPMFYAVDKRDKILRSATNTLLDFIVESVPAELSAVVAVLNLEKQGQYFQQDPNVAVWSVNDKYVWIGPPRVARGFVLISNENISEYSEDGGVPEKFSIEQFLSAVDHWNYFCAVRSEKSEMELLGRKFEAII